MKIKTVYSHGATQLDCILCHTLDPKFEFYQCLFVYKYVDQKGSAAMPAVKGSIDVTSKVNLRNPLHTGNKAGKQIHSGFEIHDRHCQKSKTGVSGASNF